MWEKYVCVEALEQSGTGAGSKCHYQLTGVRLHGAQSLWRGLRWAGQGALCMCVGAYKYKWASTEYVHVCQQAFVCAVYVHLWLCSHCMVKCILGDLITWNNFRSWSLKQHSELVKKTFNFGLSTKKTPILPLMCCDLDDWESNVWLKSLIVFF